MMYPFSYLFTVPSAAYVTMIVVNLFIGLTATMATFVLDTFDSSSHLHHLNHMLKNVLLVFPNYCLGRGIVEVARNEYQTQVNVLLAAADPSRDDTFRNPFQWSIIGRNIMLMAIQMIFWISFVVLIECRESFLLYWHNCCGKGKERSSSNSLLFREDRAEMEMSVVSCGGSIVAGTGPDERRRMTSKEYERLRVMNEDCNDNLKVIDLKKSYQASDVSR